MRLTSLLGNESLKQRLSAAGPRLSHCYIIEGPPGSGRHTLAQLLAGAMECESGGDGPCGTCAACRKVQKNEHPDVITVDSDTATVPIRLIRDMQSDAYVRPNEGVRKIYVIPRAGDMQAPAQNALLKLLEEPPEYCAFLLLTDSADKLLETVRSRAVTLSMSPLSRETLRRAILEREPEADPSDLSRAIDRSDGYLGAALTLLHSPETELDERLHALSGALVSRDELALLTALLPLEKLKRPEFLTLLSELDRTLVRAMDPDAAQTGDAKRLADACATDRLYANARAVRTAITMLQANGSAGHAVGHLMAAMR